jgi:hypothetical protein
MLWLLLCVLCAPLRQAVHSVQAIQGLTAACATHATVESSGVPAPRKNAKKNGKRKELRLRAKAAKQEEVHTLILILHVLY